ncbi:hypothetical protein ACFLYA_02320 [Candidatus Dependentiae bacterium]
MSFFEAMQEYLLGYNSFFYLRNIVEFLFFSLIIYYFSIWLKKDRHKNLLPYFYGYCAMTLVAHYTQLTTISYFLFLFSPVAIMLFILVHQKTLQKNFVAIKNIMPAKQVKSDWQNALVRSFLFAINNNKEIRCIIENKDNLENFIYSPLILNANIEQGLIKIVQESDLFDQDKMLWINTQGKLIGINASWKEAIFQAVETEIQETDPFLQSALLLSSNTDTLFLRITPTQRTFDIIFNGKMVNNIDSDNVLKIIKKYSTTASSNLMNETYIQKNLFKQRRNKL